MDANHTPKSWHCYKDGTQWVISNGTHLIATTAGSPAHMGPGHANRDKANAHLIAAAPELLEVAISNAEYRAARDHEFGRGYNAAKNGQLRDVQKESTDWYEGYDARATIAKALGEQQ